MKRVTIFVATVALALIGCRLEAQLPLPVTVEARLGYAVPLSDFGSDRGIGADPGPSFGGLLIADLSDVLGLYGGYHEARFRCSSCEGVGLDTTAPLRSYELGLQFSGFLSLGPMQPWLRGAATYQTLGFSAEGDWMTSRGALGFSGSAGAAAALGSRLVLTPGLRFLSGPANFRFSAAPDRSLTVTAVGVEIGLGYRF